MITRVDTVLIGKICPKSYTDIDSLAAGDVALFNENKGLIKTAAEAVEASAVYIGVCGKKVNITLPDGNAASKNVFEYSNPIQKASNPSYVISEYEAPVQEKVEIDFANASIVIGHRYVLHIVYKDVYEAPGQFTHTYEAIATSENVGDLGKALLKKINAHANRRITAAFSADKLTLTAMEKDDNEGVNSLNEYSIVSMSASLYVTIPGALLSNVPESVPGVVIKYTEGKPGKGYWKQVRDAEVRMMGYKGIVMTGAYPIVEQDRKVSEGTTYDCVTIKNDNLYLSPDNQYIKTTPLTTELYVEANNLSNSVFVKALKSFITGKVAQ